MPKVLEKLNQRIRNGEKAIAFAKQYGRSTEEWEKMLVGLRWAYSQEVAQRTRELLDTRGWCIWQCHSLNEEKVVIIRHEDITGYPAGYAVYTELELFRFSELENASNLRLIHEAKKLAGATVMSVELNKKKADEDQSELIPIEQPFKCRCSSVEFWERTPGGEKVCNRCHPKPGGR